MTIVELMNSLGFSYMKQQPHSQYRPTFTAKLVREEDVTITGWWIQEYEVTLVFEMEAYLRWKFKEMRDTVRKKLRQKVEFIDEYKDENNLRIVLLKVTLRHFDKRR